MKLLNIKRLVLLFSVLLPSICYSQTIQKGRVLEKDSNGKPLENAEILAKDAQPANSDNDGKYQLIFKEKSPGEMIFVDSINKKGYELVNEPQVKDWILSDKKDFNIILCRKGLLKESREHFYNIGKSHYENEYKKKKNEIDSLKHANQITEKEYNQKLKEACDERQKANEQLDYYSDLFSRINIDDLSDIEKRAYGFSKQGKIDEAIHVYEREKLLTKFIKNDSLKQQINIDIESMVPSIRRYAELCAFAGGKDNYEKAGKCYHAIALSDTTNYKYVYDYSFFEGLQRNFSESKKWMELALKLSRNFKEKIDCYWCLSSYCINGNFIDKLDEYLQSGLDLCQEQNDIIGMIKMFRVAIYGFDNWKLLSSREKLAIDNNSIIKKLPLDSVLQAKTNTSYNFIDLFNIDSIAGYYSYLADTLMKSDIPISEKGPYLISVLQDIGTLYIRQEKINDAKDILEGTLNIYSILKEETSINVDESLIGIKKDLSFIYYQLNDTTSARKTFIDLINLTKKIYESDQYINQNIYSEALANYAWYLNKIGRYIDADKYYAESINILEKKVEYLFDETLQKLSYIKMTYALDLLDRKEFEKAEDYMLSSLSLQKKVFNNGNELIKLDIVNSLRTIAIFYKNSKQFDNSEKYWKELLDFIVKQNVVYHPDYVYAEIETINNLAELLIDKGEFQLAKKQCFIALDKHQKLNAENSYNYFKYQSNSLFLLAHIYQFLNIKDSASYYFDKSLNFNLDLSNKNEAENVGDLFWSYADRMKLWHDYKNAELCYLAANRIFETDESLFSNKNIKIRGNLSYIYIFEHEFSKSETYARDAINLARKKNLDQSFYSYIYTNVAASLLFQGKFQEALKIYLEWKDKPYLQDTHQTFTDLFLQDFNEFEKVGITHPDVAKIRKLLNE